MTYSKSGLELTEQFEGCKLAAYRDVRGVLTIGYGHTGPDVYPGLTCTQEQAEAWLANDISWAANAVSRLVTLSVTQGEFDALVDFVFNVGAEAFAKSTLLVYLNTNLLDLAVAEFEKWDHANGQVVAGLLKRRQAEQAEFRAGEVG